MDVQSLEVIVMTRDRSTLLSERLESLRMQSVQGFSVTVVDNASTDDTEAVAMAFRDDFERFDYRRHPVNIGLAGTLNDSVERCTGELIALLSDDDLWAPRFVEVALTGLAAHPHATLAFTNETTIDDAGHHLAAMSDQINAGSGRANLTDGLMSNDQLRQLAIVRHGVPINGTIARTDAVQRACLEDRSGLDVCIFATMALNGAKAYYSTEVLHYYRRHDSGISQGSRSLETFAEWHWRSVQGLLERRGPDLTVEETESLQSESRDALWLYATRLAYGSDRAAARHYLRLAKEAGSTSMSVLPYRMLTRLPRSLIAPARTIARGGKSMLGRP